MTRPRLRVPRLGVAGLVAAIAAAGALAAAVPAGASVSILSPPVAGVRTESPAVLAARGAVVTVNVTVICAPGASSGNVSTEIVERVAGGNIARGFAYSETPRCTGNFQTVNLAVTAQAGKAFRAGTAFALASFNLCDDTGCRTATDQREIQIVRP